MLSIKPTRKTRTTGKRSTLTSEQLAAVKHQKGHAIVGAVAGSGKSHMLCYRNLFLLMRQGVQAQHILNVMFNRDAADQFRDRIRVLAQRYQVRLPLVHTFHSFGKRILEEMVHSGWAPEGKLLNNEWAHLHIVRGALQEAARLTNKDVDLGGETLSGFLEIIDAAKAEVIEPESSDAPLFFEQHASSPELFLAAYAAYEQERRVRGIYTFSDLLYDPVRMMRNNPELREWAANRFDHILVDEYQDVNEAQQLLLRYLAGTRADVMAVGDEDQCIYEWRGAKPIYMACEFERDFPGATRYVLSHTFRYGDRLSLLASQVISHNQERTPKICVSDASTPDTRYMLDMAKDWKDQGKIVAKTLREWLDAGRSLSEVAILVREYSQSISVETGLMDAGIPYRIVGAPPAFARQETLALQGYLAMTTQTGLRRYPNEEVRTEVIDAMSQVPTLYLPGEVRERIARSVAADPEHFADILASVAQEMPEYRQKALMRRADFLRDLDVLAKAPPVLAGAVLRNIMLSLRLYSSLRASTPRMDRAEERVRLCDEFAQYTDSYGQDVATFLNELEQQVDRVACEEGDGVLITSVHRAKGLEWPHVILPELAEGRFPAYDTQRNKAPDEHLIEQERRLFYVGVTRAQERLTMIAPKDATLLRQLARKSDVQRKIPRSPKASRFLYEARVDICRRLLACADQEDIAWLRTNGNAIDLRYLQAIDHPVAHEILPQETKFRVEKEEPPEPPAMECV